MSLARAERGQAALEFAIVMVPFFALLIGLFDLGRGVFYQQMLDHAAREGAHAGTRGLLSAREVCEAAARQVALPDVPSAPGCDGSGAYNGAGLSVAVPRRGVAGGDAEDQTVRVTMTYEFTLVTPGLTSLVSPLRLSASATGRVADAAPPAGATAPPWRLPTETPVPPTMTVAPTAEPTVEPTSQPTATQTPLPTSTPVPSATPIVAPAQTNTPAPSVTPSRTPTVVPSNTPPPTHTPTVTRTPTVTSTATRTATATRTSTPTATATPSTCVVTRSIPTLPEDWGYYYTFTTTASGTISATWTLPTNRYVEIYVYGWGAPAGWPNPTRTSPPGGALASAADRTASLSVTTGTLPAGSYTVYLYNQGNTQSGDDGDAGESGGLSVGASSLRVTHRGVSC